MRSMPMLEHLKAEKAQMWITTFTEDANSNSYDYGKLLSAEII
jgi:hypothetical protein